MASIKTRVHALPPLDARSASTFSMILDISLPSTFTKALKETETNA